MELCCVRQGETARLEGVGNSLSDNQITKGQEAAGSVAGEVWVLLSLCLEEVPSHLLCLVPESLRLQQRD